MCKSCYNILYYKEHKEEYKQAGIKWRAKPENKLKLRDKNLKYYYGITLEEFNKKVAAQNNVCLICEQAEADHVDHSHLTGEVRGILCHNCNTAIGLLKENKTTIHNAIRYLTTYD